jgi:radical SAM superfamily enzyme YgiQ (UPF0313 family)
LNPPKNRPEGIRPKNILIVGPNTKESIFDSRWVTAHQGSHWQASRLNAHGHYASTYDMNMQPGEDPDNQDHPHVSLEEIFKRGMPGHYIVRAHDCNHVWGSVARCIYCSDTKLEIEDGTCWRPDTDLLDLFTIQKRATEDTNIIWKPWDIIGFSILDATIEYDISKIIKAKQLSLKSILVGGGSQATLNYQTIFDKSPLDMVVLGQDPWALINIANEEKVSLFEPKATVASGIVMRNHAKAITTEEWTDWIFELDFQAMHQDYYWKKTACLYDNPQFQDINTFRLFMHSFCPVNCAYCTLTGLQRAATGKPTKAVGLAGTDTVKIIKRVIEKYPDTHQIFFCDDDFLLTPQWERGFTESVIAAKAIGEIPEHLGFICLTNINRLDQDGVARCAKAGMRVLSIGVESVSQWKLNSMNKPQTPERIWKTTQWILDAGIKPYYTLLIHTPYERPEDMIIDINGFRKMGKMGVGLSIEPYLMPLHGTIFFEADVPTRYKIIPIEGSRETIKKGSAWMPVRADSLAIFEKFEKYFPRYKKWVYAKEKEVRHKEKNFYSYTIMEAQEFIFKKFFPEILEELEGRGIALDEHVFKTREEIETIFNALEKMGDYDVDSVGAIVKRKATTSMAEVDFSLGRADVREMQRKMAIEAEEEERISSIDSSEQLKVKTRKESPSETSVH